MASCMRRAGFVSSSIKHFCLTSTRNKLPVRTISTLQPIPSFPNYFQSVSRISIYRNGFPAAFGVSSTRQGSTEANSKNAHTEQGQSPPPSGVNEDSATKGAAEGGNVDIQALEEKAKKLQAQYDDTLDKYRRSLAEMENVRQRLNKQVEDAKLFGIQGFCKDLLEVADVLNKATGSVPESELAANSHLRVLHEGLLLTETQLTKVFTRHGLVKINPAEGEKFDPNFHEALFQQPLVEGKAPGTVSTVTKIGYKLHNRTLRPAVVGVFTQS